MHLKSDGAALGWRDALSGIVIGHRVLFWNSRTLFLYSFCAGRLLNEINSKQKLPSPSWCSSHFRYV